MPATYNGIGTHYYGKKNAQTRPGQCRSCGRQVQLSSYDTRLWFVIFFVPVIPLDRKRIIDYCPSCRRHYVSELEKWETSRQLEISGALEKYRANPSPEAAITLHQQLLGFHQYAEAAEFQKSMLAQFPDSAKVHAYLGAAGEHLGRHVEAAESYQRALAVRPDLPEARVGAARGLIRQGRLDEARGLLDFLEKPGAAQSYSLEPLEVLARAYLGRGHYQEALELFGRILAELPKVTEHAGFRKAVQKCEKALGRPATILPKQNFSLARLFGGTSQAKSWGRVLLVVGAIAALVILGMVISNEYIRRHRELYLVNAFKTPATVEIPGVGVVRDFTGVRPLELPEGRYHAVISGPVAQELDFTVGAGYFARWSGKPLWLINVGGGAVLLETIATYTANPPPPAQAFHFGQPFEKFGTIDHPFTPLPSSIQAEAGTSRTLTSLELFTGDAAEIFEYYQTNHGPAAALNFAESWLRPHPEDAEVLGLYAMAAQEARQGPRLDSFLRSGMTNRPVLIEWHRAYQGIHDRPAEHADLLRDYDALLGVDPTNSALMYLRGRLETNRAAARDLFNRAVAADPRSPYPLYALGYDRMAAADWQGARTFIARAAGLNPRDEGYAGMLFLSRLALGEAPALETEVRKQLGPEPLNIQVELQLLDVLAAQNKKAEALRSAADYSRLCQSRLGSRGLPLARLMQYHASYAVGDFEPMRAAAATDRTPAGQLSLAAALIELGRPEDAGKQLPPKMAAQSQEIYDLALAIAFRQSGNAAAANQWQSRAVAEFAGGDCDSVQVGELLLRTTPVTLAEAENITLPPEIKAIVLACLATALPPNRSELAALAQQLNVDLSFPHHLVRRVTAPVP